MENTISWSEFEKLDIRVGTILEAEPFKEARKPAYKLKIDFGPGGIKKSSAQLTKFYKAEELPGKQIVAIVNFPPKQIADFMSECLVLGAVGVMGEVVLLSTERNCANGLKVS